MVKKNKGLYYWLPFFIWLEFIFILSSIPHAILPRMPSEGWDFWAHRTAHLVEYSVLGALFIRAYAYKKARIGVLTIVYLAFFIFLAGAFDEWHQTFVPGRNGQLIDAIFDTICGTVGMYIYFKWLGNYSRKAR